MLSYQQHIVNVVGEAEEAICDYRTCRHKLSEHGSSSRICRCCHPSNKAIGINFP
ncbi:MAG: hypothetical protein ACRD97_03090 [Nitrososphaeraceae archaeon]